MLEILSRVSHIFIFLKLNPPLNPIQDWFAEKKKEKKKGV